MADQIVLIAGAGPTGLALALWLTKLGVKVRIIDKTAEAGTTSRAVAVQARTLEFYRQIGLDDAVVGAGVQVAGLNLWVRSTRAAHVPMGRMGEGLSPFPFALTYGQDAHERLLIERLEALHVNVEHRTDLIRFEQGSTSIRATLKRPDGTEEICEAAYIAGCDGAHSTVRESLAIGFPGGTYSGLFYVADVDAAGPAANGEIHVELGEADFIAVFPLKGMGRLRLVGPVPWDAEREQRDLTFDDISERAVKNLKLTVVKVNWFSTYRVHHRVAAKFREGRAFLLGDAAHVHSPVGGQGMNTGIGDAVNLAWKLAAVLNGSGRESLLDTYEPERIAFARRLVATTDRVFTVVTKQGSVARWVRTRFVPLMLPWLFRLAFVRRFLFRTVSQIAVSYRHSPLSVGRGRGRARRRPPAVGRDRTGEKQLRSPRFADVAGSRLRRTTAGPDRSLRRTAASPAPFRMADANARAGLLQTALYLIRPTATSGLADAHGDPEQLRRYCRVN